MRVRGQWHASRSTQGMNNALRTADDDDVLELVPLPLPRPTLGDLLQVGDAIRLALAIATVAIEHAAAAGASPRVVLALQRQVHALQSA